MKFKSALLFTLTALILFSCSRPDSDTETTYISGRITVDPELDQSQNFSDIELLVSFQQQDGESRDTLFYAVTDADGYFSGTATFDERDIYPVIVSRNRNTFGIVNMVFAGGDSITFNAQIPNVNQTAEVSSRENDVLRTYERIERNFNRVAQFINAGAISEDSVYIELENWSNIYWQVYEENRNTLASEIAGNMSLSLLSGWNDSLMVERAEKLIGADSKLRSTGRNVMVNYYAETEGLDKAVSFLNRLENLTRSNSQVMTIRMDKIELLYDSSRTVEATRELEKFQQQYADNQLALEWAQNIGYDIEFLAPGSPFPDFNFVTIDGDSLSSDSMKGRPFMIEFTNFNNRLYQSQFDRTVAIYQIYNNFGLEIITVPLGTNRIMLEAFFQERDLLWELVEPDTFDVDELADRFNISRVPTRFLVDSDGNIIRRYIGNEYQDVVRGLQDITR
jgi:glutathione peroxidase-family protein